MDQQKRKQMLAEYRLRKPPMGVVRAECLATGDLFFGYATDTKAFINGLGVKLDAGRYPSKLLQELWAQYGSKGFELSVEVLLEYEDPQEDQTDELALLLEICFEEHPKAHRIRK